MQRITSYFKKTIKNVKSFDYKEYIKTNVLFIFTVLSITLNGLLLRAFTIGNVFEIRPLIGDLAVALSVCAFAYLIKPKKQIIYCTVISIIFCAICIINSMYYTFYLSFASVSLIATSFQVADVGDALIKNVIQYKDFMFLWQPIALLILHKKLTKKKYYEYAGNIENGKIRWTGTLVASSIIIAFFISTLSGLEIGRLIKQWNREFLVSKFGVYVYQLNDVVTSLEPKFNTLFGYDKAIQNVREYYENNTQEVKKNKYTNIFEGKNLIMIHAESIQQFLLDANFNGQDVTPNLKKLASEGLYFSNFYSQVGVGTSSDTEFTLSTSLLPVSSGTVFMGYFNREYVTMPTLLKEKGYYTVSMHGNNGSFWNRNVMHKNMGYDTFYHEAYYEIDEKIGLGLSDKSFFRQSIEKLKKISSEHKNYYSTLITLTNHTPFDEIDKYGDFPVTMKIITDDENGENVEVERSYMEGTTLGNYFKSSHYADSALGELIDGLDKEGLLENTVIVIYGDHDSRLSKSEYSRYYNYDPYTDELLPKEDPDYKKVDYYSYELNRKVPLIIWSKNTKLKTEIKEVMGMYDVMPTLGNMFGFKSEYALGSDIFSKGENMVVFPNGNWLTNKIYYNTQKQEYLPLTEDVISEAYIDEHNINADKMVSVSNDLIIYDYIRHKRENENLLKGDKNE